MILMVADHENSVCYMCEAIFFIETLRARIFAKNTQQDIIGVQIRRHVLGPFHKAMGHAAAMIA